MDITKALRKDTCSMENTQCPPSSTWEKMGCSLLRAWEVSEEGLADGHNAGGIIIHKRDWRRDKVQWQ